MLLILSICFSIKAQFAPAAGTKGSTAIHKDSSIIKEWATSCQVIRGYINISDKSLGRVSVGLSKNAIGKSQERGIVSLGDSGYAIMTFNNPIKNIKGFDFAVFENSFDGLFLEFAFVEVSEDGKKYVRFPSVCLNDTIIQKGTFGISKTEKIKNLAGKYEAGYGTPFELEELKDSLNVNNINFVKIIDVVGSIDSIYVQRDSKGKIINDPFPTPFPSCGFDLDAVAILKTKSVSLDYISNNEIIYPNPIKKNETIKIGHFNNYKSYRIINIFGEILDQNTISEFIKVKLNPGTYFVVLEGVRINSVNKIVVFE